MSEWRYIAERLNGDGTSTLTDLDLPLAGVEIEEALSAPGGLSASISPEYARLKDINGDPLLDELATAIWAEKDSVIRGGGLLVDSSFNGPNWDLSCVGFMGYFKDMPYTGEGVHFEETDTLDIVRAIIDHVQTQPGSNIGLEVAPTMSGHRVGSTLASEEYDPAGGGGGLTLESQSYKLAWYQDHDLASNIDDLAEASPFDYRERHFWDGDVIRHSLDFSAPYYDIAGKTPHWNQITNEGRFVFGENIFVTPDVARSGGDYASDVYYLGAGEGSEMIRGYWTGPRKRLRKPVVVSDPSIRNLAIANWKARSEWQWRQTLEDVTEFTLLDHPSAPVGSVQVGTNIVVQGKTGWVDLNTTFRVLSVTTRPDNPEAVTLSVSRTDRLPSF